MNGPVRNLSILLTAIIIFVSTPVVSSAAEGWQREDREGKETWVYLNQNGNYVKDTLIKSDGGIYYLDANGVMAVNRWSLLPDNPGDSNGFGNPGGEFQEDRDAAASWYYFSSSGKAFAGMKKQINGVFYLFGRDGRMISSAWIEQDGDTYYVDENGVMAVNRWVAAPGEEETDAPLWYYFGSSGKAYKGTRKTVGEQTYIFDDKGGMVTGRLVQSGDDKYYVDKDGVMAVNQWVSFPNDYGNENSCDEPVSTLWYYFGSSGKAVSGKKKEIGGQTYIFDDEGHMLAGWQAYGDEDDWYYLGTEDQGYTHTGWQYMALDGDMSEEVEIGWYYLDSKGVPFNYNGKDSYRGTIKDWDFCQRMDGFDIMETYRNIAVKVIDNKTYLFDGNGKMMTGFFYLQGVRCTGGSDLGVVTSDFSNGETFLTGDFYYFNETEGAALGQMVTGTQKLKTHLGTINYYFQKNGSLLINTILDGYLYGSLGAMVKEEAYDFSGGYYLYEVSPSDVVKERESGRTYSGCTLIIKESGKVKRSGTVVIDGIRYTVSNSRVVREEPVE